MLPLVIGDLGGWSAFVAAVPEHSFRMIPLRHDFGSWLQYLRDWALIGIGSIAAQDLLQRAFSARDERTAERSAYAARFGYLTLGVIPVLLGLAGTISLASIDDPELVVPQLALNHLPPLAVALFVGALLAAIMSTADSALLAAASIVSTNLLPFVRPDASQRTRLLCSRISVPIAGVLALVVALRVQAVYELMLAAMSITLVSVIVPVTAGIYWKRANRSGALASMLGGALVWGLAAWKLPDLPGDLLGFVTSAVVMVVVTLTTSATDIARPLRSRDGELLPSRSA